MYETKKKGIKVLTLYSLVYLVSVAHRRKLNDNF